MDKLFYIIPLLLVLSCSSSKRSHNTVQNFSTIPSHYEYWKTDAQIKMHTHKIDSLLEPINRELYEKYQYNYHTSVAIDTTLYQNTKLQTDAGYYNLGNIANKAPFYAYGGFYKDLNFHYVIQCGYQICEAYLLDHKIPLKMALATNFDSGPHGLRISSKKDKLAVFAAYDSADYDSYYDYRSEIILYNSEQHKGVEGIKINRIYTTTEWSIVELIWIDHKSIAIKAYSDNRTKFSYFKAQFK